MHLAWCIAWAFVSLAQLALLPFVALFHWLNASRDLANKKIEHFRRATGEGG